MSKTLYRKYRPKKFEDIVGQKHIVTTLSNSIQTNRLSHAYLFTGPRGTGKTSIARLFAKAINCTKRDNFSVANETTCQEFTDGSAIDLIEIDAASHTGVDNIRELRETISLTPTSAPFKIYIIDEVHMLSTGAFNALLKTLEEPPSHAIFILATTEAHKVPDTIISRCQRYDFSRISLSDIISKLKYILNKEDVIFEDEALEMIAISSNGGMRDAESLLAQILSFTDKSLTKNDVMEVLGITSQKQIFSLIASIAKNDINLSIEIINKVSNDGYNLEIFIASTITALRALLFYTLSPTKEMESYMMLLNSEKETLRPLVKNISTKQVIKAIEEFEKAKIKISSSVIPQLPLEIAVVNVITQTQALNSTTKSISSIKKSLVKTPNPIEEISNKNNRNLEINQKKIEQAREISSNLTEPEKPTQKIKHTDQDIISLENIKTNWSKIVDHTKKDNMSLSSLLVQAHPMQLESNILTLAVRYQLHKDKLLENKNRLTIEKILDIVMLSPISIEAQVVSEKDFYELSPSELLSKAANIIGGGQIVKSTINS